MRIALLPSSYAPFTGGVEELTRNLAFELRHQGHDVEVWTSRPSGHDLDETSQIDGITVRRFNFVLPAARLRSVASFPLPSMLTLQALRRAARSFRPDVLHVQCFGPNGVYATVLSRLAAIPLVLTLQGETQMDDQDIFEHSSSLRAGLRAGLRRAAVVTACSNFTLMDAKRRFGLATDSGHVVFNAVPITEERAATGTSVSLPYKRYVLCMGRVVHKKGFDLLLQAFADIAGKHSDVGLVIAGDGAERKVLEGLATELDVAAQVYFPGRLDRAAVATAMADAEIFVMPSRLEPFGIVVLEGWRAGVAIIATSRGGPPEYVQDGVDGLLVDPFDTDQLASALSDLLGDRARREAIAHAGQRRVAEFTWPVITDAYLGFYRSALSARLKP